MSYRNKRLLDAAKGQACTICGAVGSTVACHANSVALGKGTGIKAPDYYAAHMCQHHHDLYDGRIGRLTKEEKEALWMTAFLRTIKRLFDQGIVEVK